MRKAITLESLENRRLLSAGGLDTTFNTTGKLTMPQFGYVTRLAIQSNAKIDLATEPDPQTSGLGAIVQLNSNGSLDSTFKAPNGSTTGFEYSALTTDMALTTNGEIIGLGGDSLMELLSNGSHDPAFGVNGTAIPGTGLRMALSPTNQIIVAYTGSSGGLFVRRYAADGTWDTMFGNKGDTNIGATFGNFTFKQVAVTFDGQVLLFGNEGGTSPSLAVIRLNAKGQIDMAFGTGGMATVPITSTGSVATGVVTPDDKILVGGQLGGHSVVVGLTNVGQIDTTFGSGGYASISTGLSSGVNAISSGPDGRIYLAGSVRPFGSSLNVQVIRLNQSGTIDKTFGSNGVSTFSMGAKVSFATSIALGIHNRVIVGGAIAEGGFTQADRMAVAALNGGSVLSDNDDQISEAKTITLNSTTNMNINAPDDVDIRKFTVPTGQRESFQITQPGVDLFDPYLKIFKSDGSLVVANDGGFAPGTLFRGGAPLPLDPYLDYTFTSGGTYYIAISSNPDTNYNPVTGADGDVRGYGGAYSLILKSLTNTPGSHNKLSTAVGVGFDGIGSAFISSSDVLMVRFDLKVGSMLTVNLNKVAGNFDSYLRLFDSNGNQLAANDNGPTPNEPASKDSYLTYTATAAGTYYIGISTSKNKTYNPVTGTGDVSGGAIGSFNVHFSGIPLVFGP